MTCISGWSASAGAPSGLRQGRGARARRWRRAHRRDRAAPAPLGPGASGTRPRPCSARTKRTKPALAPVTAQSPPRRRSRRPCVRSPVFSFRLCSLYHPNDIEFRQIFHSREPQVELARAVAGEAGVAIDEGAAQGYAEVPRQVPRRRTGAVGASGQAARSERCRRCTSVRRRGVVRHAPPSG